MDAVLKNKTWQKYLKNNNFTSMDYLELYICTYNYTQIYKIKEYYFTFGIKRGYKNISSLKKLI